MDKVLIKGNEAIAEAAIRSGCKLFFGYPITPSTEIMEYLSKNMPKAGGTILQGEDEVASINMCYGAAATGARVMTASSSPGFSLKQEGLSYIAAAELPVVVVNVNRSGPGLGGLGPAQSDYFQCTKGGGHGDYRLIVLAPSKGQEMYDFTMQAFDLADKYRNPVLILADGFLGQMMEPIELKERPAVNLPAKDWVTNGCRGRNKRKIASYALTNEIGEANCMYWQTKYKQIKEEEQRWESYQADDAEYLLVGYGTCGRIAKSVVINARKHGIKLGLIRPISLWPFPENAFKRHISTVKGIVAIELNAGQMVEDIRLAVNCKIPVELYNRQGGMLPTETEIFQYVSQVFNLKLPEEG
ncbi:3-methyl-2-oxobutanoate dehydrogenase subunit VorB [Dendrosporobacter sp. 1207_IL3150]|uniref:3-methyl-2-oxobutanoate dehydrogenase subunit VorB n=1 Tax=Dendrosporobacter sp. 1207_IL3150 TaxID=3084054 RepID=UPI002FDA7C6F